MSFNNDAECEREWIYISSESRVKIVDVIVEFVNSCNSSGSSLHFFCIPRTPSKNDCIDCFISNGPLQPNDQKRRLSAFLCSNAYKFGLVG